MMNGDKKLICFLVASIILVAIILLVKIKMTLKYNPVVYNEIYTEYEAIFGNSENDNLQNDINIVNQNNDKISNINYNELATKNVIGQIIIHKIDIKYPIIKETTKEYLEVAPTKYCGPDVNKVRKFGYCWA